METKLRTFIFFLLVCLLSFSKGTNGQAVKLIHYWDFNNTQPSSGAGGDSLGTTTFPLPAQYSTIPSGNPRMVYSHPSADGILDNGTAGSFINDLKVLGNDSAGTAAGNLYVRGRNPSLGDAFVWYLPTTGYKNIIIAYVTEVSSTKSGPQYEKFQYSSDGGVTWDSVPANAITATGTVTGSFVNVNNSAYANWQLVQVNFSAITAINNNANFIFKVSQGGSNATGTSGNCRYDNVSLTGDTNLSTTPLSATISSSTNVACFITNTGNATVTTSGGNPPYTYNWSPVGGTNATASNLSAGSYTVVVTDASSANTTATVTVTQPAPIRDSIFSSINNVCYGANTGSATLGVKGGTPPYTYNWLPVGGTNASASNLSAGTYSITVTDANGCFAPTAAATITQPSAIAVTTSTTNASCGKSNGSVSITATTGGTAPYAYDWSNGATTTTVSGLVAGNYTLTVTDHNGCTASTIVSVVDGGGPSITISSITNILCNGASTGIATASVSGGASPYTYNWSNGSSTKTASNLSAGSYSITVTDANNCSDNKIVTITQPSAIGVTTSTTNASCGNSNGSASVTSTTGGTAPYTYNWSNGIAATTISSVMAGSYTLIVTDRNGCTGSAVAVILNNSGPSVTISSTNILCNGTNTGIATANVSGGASPYTYNWSPSGGNNAVASNLSAGTYTVNIIDANGCAGTASVLLTQPASALADSIVVSNISCNGVANGSATAIASGGTSPYNYNWSPAGGTNANATGLTAGTYTITITDANKCSVNTKISITQPTALIASVSNTNATCAANNGTATITATGGTAPYTYNWSPAGGSNNMANNLSAGAYTVTLTDNNGCSASFSTFIAQASSPTVLIHYWDFNNTVPSTGKGGDSLGTATFPLAAQYSTISGGNARMVYSHPSADGILDNGTPGSYINDLKILGNDSAGTAAGNLYVRGRNPSLGDAFYWYLPTTGYKNAVITYATEVSSTTSGPQYEKFQYSPDGGITWDSLPASIITAVGGVTGSFVNVNNSAYTNWQPVQINFSSINVANNNPNFIFRISQGGTNATEASGNCRYDNVSLSGDSNVAPVAIVSQPSAQTACSGNSASFGVKVSGGYDVTYQWQQNNGSGFNNLNNGGIYSGVNNDTLKISVVSNSMNNYKYRCMINGYCPIDSSAAATLTVPVIFATIGSVSNVVCFGNANGSATVSVSGGTSPYTYGWIPNVSSTATANNLSVGTYSVTVTDANGCSSSTVTISITEPSALKDSIVSFNNELCNGGKIGSATVSVSGGTSPYTYGWSNGATTATASNLAAGTYSVTVKDANGCSSSTLTVFIAQPSAITASASGTNASCGKNNGSASVTSTTGGTLPYTYNWSNGSTTTTASNLAAGTYTLIVTDHNGCNGSTTVNILNNGGPSATLASVTNILCNGSKTGSVTVSVSGGTSPYTYGWTPNVSTTATANNLSAGTYSVTVTDANGCSSSTVTASITQPSAIGVITSTTNASCGKSNGSASVTITTGGTLPYTYSWSSGSTTNTASNLAAGTYTLIVTDHNGCNGSTTVNIISTGGPSLAIASSTNILCNGSKTGSAVISVSGGTLPYTYGWTPNVSSTATANNLSAGTYSVTVTNANGCSSSTATVTITQPSALKDSLVSSNELCNGGNNGSATVFVSNGIKPYTYAWSNGVTNATVSNLSAGTYSITITDANGCNSTTSITISQPGAIVAIASSSPATCTNNSGSASVTVSGGISPYTYNWSNGATTVIVSNLSAGTYSVTVTDKNGCSANTKTVVGQGSGITVVTSYTMATCTDKNGSAGVRVSGGTSPYTYAWSTVPVQTKATATGLAAGTYTCIITDKTGCSTNSIVIVPGTAETVTVVSVTNELCNGERSGSSTVSVSGGSSPYTYVWSPVGGFKATASNLAAGNYTITVIDHKGCVVTAQATVTQPTLLIDSVVTSTLKNVSCNGSNNGSVTIGVKGGTAPYTYVWFPSVSSSATASNLLAGTYSVAVEDANGCSTKTLVIKITQPVLLRDSAVVFTLKNISCNGGNNGSITIGVKGGTSPYAYTWSPNVSSIATANNLSAGSYIVTVTDANGCSATTKTTLTQPALLRDSIVASSIQNITCNGESNGSATVGVKGGTSPYAYQWSNGALTATVRNLAVGSYTVTVTDRNGCSGIATVTITQPPLLISSIVSYTNELCNGNKTGSATVSVSGGTSPYIYEWIPGGQTTATASNLAPGTYVVIVKDKNNCTTEATVTITQPALLRDSAVASTIKNISCNGGDNGSATIGVKGGSIPYTYAWSPNVSSSAMANNLSAGSYVITVTDANGCSAVTKIAITQPTLLRDSIIASSVKNVSCNVNGSATVGVKGGTSPYSYKWSNGATTATTSNLSAATYSVTVTDKNGCSAVATITITQSAPLISSITSSTNDLCNGTKTGSATVTVSGGTSPYVYQWTPGGETTPTVSNLAAGSYTVIVKDKNNCTTQANVTITQPAKIRDSIVSQVNVSCNGTNTGSIVIGVKGGRAPYTYVWSPNVSTSGSASNLAADDYLITVTDANGCEGSYIVATITEPLLLDAAITKTSCTTTNTGSATVVAIGGELPYVYLWSPSGETTATATKLTAGTYTVTVTDKNKCDAIAIAKVLNCNDLPLGVEVIDSVINKVTVFPDPTLGNFSVEGVMPGQVIEIYSYTGQELNRVTVENNTTMHFDISNRPNGIYLIRIENADGSLATEKKIVKTQ